MRTLFFLLLSVPTIAPVAAAPQAPPSRVTQMVQEYFLPLQGEGADSPHRFFTHLGTPYGPMGPGEAHLAWKPGVVEVDLSGDASGWAGVWHRLAAKDQALDLARCYPAFIRSSYQPRCVGILLRAGGKGTLKLELKSPDEQILWSTQQTLESDDVREYRFPLDASRFRRCGLLSWVAEPGTRARVDALALQIELPAMPQAERVFLFSYAKLARCYAEADGVVGDGAQVPPEQLGAVPASGLFCLATCAAWRLGMVERSFAAETLRKGHGTIAALPRADGLLPHFIRKQEGRYSLAGGSEYSTVDSALCYHGMLLAAQMLSDGETLAALRREIEAIRFDDLRDPEGYVIHGLRSDGKTKIPYTWRGWGGEAALVLLLQRMAAGAGVPPRMELSGRVYNGVGFIAEIQSLFYPQFSQAAPDAVSGVDWPAARRKLLAEQQAYFGDTPAGRIGLYGLSAGEGPRGKGYRAQGTETPGGHLIHPHYFLMSAVLRDDPAAVYRTLGELEKRGLLPPWGMVENVSDDLSEYLPFAGSLNASFECLGAYHLWAQATGKPDAVYEAARTCPPTAEAIRAFYP